MKQIKFRMSDEMYVLLFAEASRSNKSPNAYSKQIVEQHITGGNSQLDSLRVSMEQLTHRIYAAQNEGIITDGKIIEGILGLQQMMEAIEEKQTKRSLNLQKTVNLCAAFVESAMQKDGSRDEILAIWKEYNIKTGASKE